MLAVISPAWLFRYHDPISFVQMDREIGPSRMVCGEKYDMYVVASVVVQKG